MSLLPDGSYDVVVVDVETDDVGQQHVELVITLGPQVGRVVSLRAPRRDHGPTDETAWLGRAGTLRVAAGVPVFRPESV